MRSLLVICAAVTLGFGASCGSSSSSGVGGTQAPINITFDLHSDPESPVMTIDERRAYFELQLTNAEWLLTFLEPYGVKVSFLAVGEFYEFCVEESEKERCFALQNRLYESGGIIGTHQHTQYWRGSHDWPDTPNGFNNPAEADVRKVWADGHRFTDAAITAALGLTDETAIAAINTAAESQAQLADPCQLMEEYGYTVRQGGADQTLVPLFGHVPWNPFRPGATATAEDLSTPFVTIPQGMVIGHTGLHLGVTQDGRVPRKQAEFLELYTNWRARELSGAAPKVWTFGWGVHTQDLNEGSESRAAIQEIIPWLSENFIGASSPSGHPIARYASYIEVRDEYLAWEAENPSVSSFNYDLKEADYNAYPYLEWANRYFINATMEDELAGSTDARVFSFLVESHKFLLALAGDAGATVDASILGENIRLVNLESGQTNDVAATAVAVPAGGSVLCVPSECDAILAVVATPTLDDLCSASDTACPNGEVCAVSVSRCVADCRLENPCPALHPTCSQDTGVCQ
jgi:hypothetical protein